MTDIKKTIGESIRQLRKARGMSQIQLGEITGLHRTYINTLEHGHRNITIENLERIADALGVCAFELMDTDTPNPQRKKFKKTFHHRREVVE